MMKTKTKMLANVSVCRLLPSVDIASVVLDLDVGSTSYMSNVLLRLDRAALQCVYDANGAFRAYTTRDTDATTRHLLIECLASTQDGCLVIEALMEYEHMVWLFSKVMTLSFRDCLREVLQGLGKGGT